MRQDVVATAVADGRFSQLVGLVQMAGLDAALDGSLNNQRWTVFAPTDDAFGALPPALVTELLNDAELLSKVLTYHVIAAGVRAGEVVASDSLTTLNAQRIDVTVTSAGVQVDQANLLDNDILCTNGVIHVIDEVLLPSLIDIIDTASAAGNFTALETALISTGLDAALRTEGPFTVFAPDDLAFSTLPAGLLTRLLIPGNNRVLSKILLFHVVPGRLFAEDVIAAGQLTTLNGDQLTVTVVGNDAFVNGVKIVATDLQTDNGNIHIIENVLIP